MVSAGMDAVRINMAHGSTEQHRRIVGNIKKVDDLTVVYDIKGPEVRVTSKGDCNFNSGDEIDVGFDEKSEIYFSKNIYSQLKRGDRVLIADGLIDSVVASKRPGTVKLSIKNRGSFCGNKGVNFPGKHMKIPTLSSKDKRDVEFALRNHADYIALSFVRNAIDVKNLKRLLEGTEVGIIAKIENKEGVENIDEIIEASDGIMVARGDLGVEVPTEHVPLLQKEIIAKCNIRGKIVIVATEMLKSMVENIRPTRAETSDVANAVLDGADALMLSEETTIGKYPTKVVETMRKIIVEVQQHIKSNIPEHMKENIHSSIAKAAYDITQHLPVTKIVTLTRSGHTARLISRFRINRKIIALTNSDVVKRKLGLVYGVTAVIYKDMPKRERMLKSALYLKEKGLASNNDLALFTAGIYTSHEHATNVIQIHKIGDLVDYYHKKHA